MIASAIEGSPLRLTERYRSYSGFFSKAAVLVGVSVLLGWWRGIDLLKGIFPGLVAMNPATAVCFILSGAALFLAKKPIHPRQAVAPVPAAAPRRA